MKQNSIPSCYNTGESPDELRQKYNPEGSILRKLQLRMLDMLIYLDKVCKEENIIWRLDAGQVLGAYRHGGFIPWDDDVDIVLLPNEHRRLIRYLEKHPHPQFVLQTNKTDKFYSHGWAVLRDTKSEYIQNSIVHNARKYRGAQIDIFMYDNHLNKHLSRISTILPGINARFFIGRNSWIAQTIYVLQEFLLNPCLKGLGYFFSSKEKYAHSYGLNGKFISSDALFPYKGIMFEGFEFPAPGNVEQYLEEKFGKDYMNLPPIEERDHHKASYRIW